MSNALNPEQARHFVQTFFECNQEATSATSGKRVEVTFSQIMSLDTF